MTGLSVCRWLMIGLLLAPGITAGRPTGTVNVMVSILPQKYLVERIGGDRTHVEVMVRPGFNAETYEPLPQQMTALARTDVYFRIGVPFESIWIKKIAAMHPAMQIADCCSDLIPAPTQATATNAGDLFRHVYDAHVWTSPRNAVYIADMMLEILSEMDPASSTYYRNNHQQLVEDLARLDGYIRQQLDALTNRYLLVAHPSWGYFADAYGLTQIALERHGTEIRPRDLSGLIDFARNNDIRTVYIEKQFASASARLLAREINATVVELDPLAEDYINNLRQVAQAIAGGAR